MSKQQKAAPIALEAGQRWFPAEGKRAKPRTVVWVGKAPPPIRTFDYYPTVGWAHDPQNPGFPDLGHDSWLPVASFRVWIRKHNATTQES